MGRKEADVDVIIPVYRADEKLRRLLEGLRGQRTKASKIILLHTLDGRSLAWTRELGENIEILEIPPEEFDHGGTRDKGIGRSKAEFFVLMTQDAIPANERLLSELLKPFREERTVLSYARQLPAEDCDIIERYTRAFNYPPRSEVKSKASLPRLGIKTYFCSNVCAAYRREAYVRLGGFEKRTILNEDMLYAAKAVSAGFQAAYAAKAKVIHSHNYSLGEQFRRNFDIGVSQAEHREIFEGVSSEREGLRLVGQTAAYLIRAGRPFKILILFLKSGAKFLGYRLGKHYEKLPLSLVRRCGMNKGYWRGLGKNTDKILKF